MDVSNTVPYLHFDRCLIRGLRALSLRADEGNFLPGGHLSADRALHVRRRVSRLQHGHALAAVTVPAVKDGPLDVKRFKRE